MDPDHDGKPMNHPTPAALHHRRQHARLRAARFIGAAGWCLLGSGCTPSVLDPVGPVGAAERTILFNATIIMLAIVVPTMLATVAFAWWYRAGNDRARYLPNWSYSGRIEMITWSIPVLVIMFLGGMTWIGAHDLDPYKRLKSSHPAVDIEAVSLDWKWLFIYPSQGIAAVNQLIVPVGVPLHFALTSASVMNTFFVPQLGSMIYTMNAMSDQLNLQADKTGVFYGRSAHFSGDGFSDMQFLVHVVSPDEFKTWVDSARRAGPVLNSAAYTDLAKQSTNVAPFTYRAVEPGLYDMVVTQQLPPGPGPQRGRPTPEVSPRSGPDDAR
jgi:cytochrome o ubiquinol oxidase subunit 2